MNAINPSRVKPGVPDYLSDISFPHGFNIINDAAGFERAMEFCLAKGGMRIFIPANGENSYLVDYLGEHGARALSAKWPAYYFIMPLMNNALILWLHHEKEMSTYKIANRLRVSVRKVNMVIGDKVPKHPGFSPASNELSSS